MAFCDNLIPEMSEENIGLLHRFNQPGLEGDKQTSVLYPLRVI